MSAEPTPVRKCPLRPCRLPVLSRPSAALDKKILSGPLGFCPLRALPPSARGRRPDRFRPRLQDGTRRHRVEAQGLHLPLRPLARLAQDEEPGGTGREARRGRGLGQMTRTHFASRVERWAKNRPPKGKGGPRLGSLDKDWVPS